MREKEYLDEQSRQARRGIGSGVHDLESDLDNAARACMQEHPILTLVAAAAAGFLATEIAPSIGRMSAKTAAAEKPAPDHSTAGQIWKEVAKAVVMPALVAVLESAARRKTETNPQEANSSNGQ